MKRTAIGGLPSAFSVPLNAESRVPSAHVVRHVGFDRLAAACWQNGGACKQQMLPELWKSNIQEVS